MSSDETAAATAGEDVDRERPQVPEEHEAFPELEGTDYERATEFLRGRVAFTAREWAIARLGADFRTRTGVEMTTIGENLPALVPFMDEPYTRQAVYEARRSFEEKVREAGATFLYGAASGFFAPEELDDVLYEATEVSRFLLEVEGASVPHDREAEVDRRVSEAMRAVHDASAEVRYDSCPHCGESLGEDADDIDADDTDADDADDTEVDDAADEEQEAADDGTD